MGQGSPSGKVVGEMAGKSRWGHLWWSVSGSCPQKHSSSWGLHDLGLVCLLLADGGGVGGFFSGYIKGVGLTRLTNLLTWDIFK